MKDTIAPLRLSVGRICSHAPLRPGLAGGGTDVWRRRPQRRYAFAFIGPAPDGQIHFIASDLESDERFPLGLEALEGAKLVRHAAGFMPAHWRFILQYFLCRSADI